MLDSVRWLAGRPRRREAQHRGGAGLAPGERDDAVQRLRHRVDIVVEGKVLNWPILLSDIDAQSRAEEIKQQLAERRGWTPRRAAAANFEEWCLELTEPILYERYSKPCTEKQWDRPARDVWRRARRCAVGRQVLVSNLRERVNFEPAVRAMAKAGIGALIEGQFASGVVGAGVGDLGVGGRSECGGGDRVAAAW
jgi:hypothetical protein